MLDFVIDLLIFFIITAVFVKESGLTVNRPAASPDDTGESWNIMIFDDGAIFLDNRRVDARAVRANVERMTAGRPDRGVMIVAQNGVPHGHASERRRSGSPRRHPKRDFRNDALSIVFSALYLRVDA